MPKIREYVSQGAPQRGIETRRATGVSTGSALADVGETVFRLAEHYESVRRQNLLDTKTLAAAQELAEYSFELQNGTMREDGTFEAPPDPVEHYGLYQAKVKEINERTREELGNDQMYSAFQQKFAPQVLARSFDVRKNSLDKQKALAIADIEANEDEAAELIAASGSALGEDAVTKATRAHIGAMHQRAVQAGVLDGQQAAARAARFNSKVAVAFVRRDIRQDPSKAIELLSGTGYQGLDVDAREKWLTLAVREAERREQQRDRDNATTDPDVYSRLRIRAGLGKDIRAEATQAYKDGKLNTGNYNTLLTEFESHQDGAGRAPAPYKQAAQYITKMTGGENVVDFARMQRQAQALDELAFWYRNHPEATADELDAQARSILKRALVVEPTVLNLLAPKFSPDSRLAPTEDGLAQAFKRTEEEFKAQRISKREYDREVLLIKEWRDLLIRQRAVSESEPKDKASK